MKTPQPIKNKILGELIDKKATESGIILLEDDLDAHEVIVLAIGPRVKHVKIGDTVRFDPSAAVPYDLGKKKCVFFREEGMMFLKN